MMAGLVCSLISAPVEHGKIRVQMQIHGGEYKGSVDALWRIYKQYGLRGVYHGYTATLGRELVPTGLFYLNFEVAKRKLKTKGKVYFSEIFPAGAFAGFSYWLVSYPLDLIKTRVQYDSLERP
jgi:solute carrier family 25 (mitochondrial carnitine/acylcarnitine transporter), member 20/29